MLSQFSSVVQWLFSLLIEMNNMSAIDPENNNKENVNYLEVLPGGHCFRCHKDFREKGILEHLIICEKKDTKPVSCIGIDISKPICTKRSSTPESGGWEKKQFCDCYDHDFRTAVRRLAQICDTHIINDDTRTTASMYVQKSQEIDLQRYIKHLESEISSAEERAIERCIKEIENISYIGVLESNEKRRGYDIACQEIAGILSALKKK